MEILLAALSAVAYGAADFLGGKASKSAPALVVTGWSQLVGLVSVTMAAAVFGWSRILEADLLWGAGAGVAGAVGLVLLYSGLAVAPMAVVAPITAICAATVPVVVGIASGDRPRPIALVGMALAIPAILLISREDRSDPEVAKISIGRVLGLSMSSGLAFGFFYVAFAQCDTRAGLWPAVAARVASVLLVAGIIAFTGERAQVARGHRLAIIGIGLLDVAANCLYLVASQRGLLSIVSVVASMYPASTVVLAWFVLRERMNRHQLMGVCAAALAVGLVAAGRS